MVTSQPAELRERILDEAARLFVAYGYHGISMREIAEAAGLSKAGLYYHFKDKEDLFLAILSTNLERIEQAIRAARGEGPVRKQLSRVVKAIFAIAPEQRAIIRLASQEIQHTGPEARARFGALYQEKFVGQIEGMLRAGVESGELAPMDVRLGTWVLLGMMYPFFYPTSAHSLGISKEAIALMLRIFFDGAGAEGWEHAPASSPAPGEEW